MSQSLKQAVNNAAHTRTRCDSFNQSRVVVDSRTTTNLFVMSTSLDADAFEAWLRDNWDRVKHAFTPNHRKNIESLLKTKTITK